MPAHRSLLPGLGLGWAAAVAPPGDRVMRAVGHRSAVGSGTKVWRDLVGLERFVGLVAAATVVRRSPFERLATFIRVSRSAGGRWPAAREVDRVVGVPSWRGA